jgi:hypothetical protein
MARKKVSPPPPQVPLELTTAREGAEERIKERVSKGAEIIEVQIKDPQALVAAEKEYGKWNSFNLELLKRLFTSDELCMEYNRYTGGMTVMMREKHLGEKASDFY